MTKTLNQIIFFSSTKIRIFFSATLGIRIFFLEKKHTPHFQVKWSFPKIKYLFRTVEVYSLRGDVQRCWYERRGWITYQKYQVWLGGSRVQRHIWWTHQGTDMYIQHILKIEWFTYIQHVLKIEWFTYWHKMKTNKYHTVRIVSKPNIKIGEVK